jgi:hypothetical protein
VPDRFDQVTPPRYGEQIADRFASDVTVTMQAHGRAPLLNAGACGLSVLQQFLAGPQWRPDLSCAWEPPDVTAQAAAPA